jgi:hypothetical protein
MLYTDGFGSFWGNFPIKVNHLQGADFEAVRGSHICPANKLQYLKNT